ncbi:hypothetical protein N234_35555 [Ralstonia pickettii DTP0602]|nr:hypothetical protein N234_35555 [Ralstonia pickettii DTP0602]
MGLLFAGQVGSANAGPASHTVTMDSIRFDPQELTVKAGDTVVWINKDPFPHTVTAQAGDFDSKTIATGKSWKYRATKAGVFPYVCTLHPTMKGTLRVE